MLKVLDHLEEWLIATLMGAATLITFASVVHRYGSGVDALQPILANIHMSWAQELTIYLFVWMAKFGAAYGVRTGIHVGVDVLINKLNDKNRAVFIVFGLLAGALFTGIIGTLGATFVWEIGHTEQTSVDLELPMWLVYLAVPCGSYLMSFRFLQVTWSFIKTGDLPKHDHAHVEGMDDETAQADWDVVEENLHPHGLKHGGEKQ
ncbi:TRAP transporter small permease [Pseudogulbenkiania sp. MAI-1]|uniref:TRAP transporter small permease n=1 Tax=Pseudogulbenkiania sp. MAI-1 TaxID=990370 RepID=UPI00045EAD6F|nr:TRAP transporter small permease [Pseudogulbenkiania sp. MAI-1]